MTSSTPTVSGEPLPDAHALTTEQVLGRLGTSRAGLNSGQAAALLERHGPNALPEAEQETWWQRLLRQFNDPMIYVLIAAGVLTAVLGQVIDTIVIFAVVLVNGLVGFLQEGRAADALASIKNMLSPESEVRRDGGWVKLPSEELVIGDVVRLRAGDKVPADLRLLEVASLRIEESALTGESVPSEKSLEPAAGDAGVGDRPGMAFSGTTVAAGTGTGVVTGTAAGTEIGKITTMLDDVQQVETPLTRAMGRFSSMLAIVAVVLATAMIVVSWALYRTGLVDLLMSAIGFAVAAIPEGLPAVMAITLALGVQTMAGRKAITRRMNSVETLGSVTTICTDKTGTLTRNEMTVRAVVTRDSTYQVTGTGYAPEGEVRLDGETAALDDHPDLAGMARVAAYANDSDVVEQPDGSWALQGEPTDGSITTFAMKANYDNTGRRLDEVPFDSSFKYMASLDEVGDDLVIHLKGAPDRLLDRADSQLGRDGTPQPLERDFWERQIEELGSRGLRVLAAAYRRADAGSLSVAEVDAGGFTFVGLYGMIDPPRGEAVDAVRQVQEAGITVRMITGDHATTAAAIAEEIGIASGGTLTGADIEDASDEELQEMVREASVYARTSPEHKLRLVRALQANGEVVSMTGDGVNDAPSLKQADVGVAMGVKGTEATKDAADIVLADDNFATIADAVKMGRTIFDNLRKAIVFMLPTNGAQGLIIFVAMLAGMTLPITPLQVLWVNLITAVTLSLALSFEPSEPGIMQRKPRDPKAGLLNSESVIRILYVSLLVAGITIAAFLWADSAGFRIEESRTLAVNTLVVAQIFYLFTARFTRVSALRSELFTTNPISWLCVAVMFALQLVFVYVPGMQYAFGTTAVSLRSWLIPVVAGVVVFAVVEGDKAIRRARHRN
ncbi:HAD-IC family P-type ATPase [Corynebacterium guangdongense]|uniref:Magnesium-transporting ATPase (P-type) n=1 Tax=Corynebacterium guangdongense TaxID=1783348 RepID=A0ABU1ZWR4_9CORY|nr:HAD-IC family P-type ATPase [Corynebacterium guangdongense]MDR7329374.1 magnesium-transporting ATPase (P-type) [Corynebacterium guangdongense]WJZ17939.1 putative cation-transporting ATPase F [Corynebacterium guangdongense]